MGDQAPIITRRPVNLENIVVTGQPTSRATQSILSLQSCFVGREYELEAIEQYFKDPSCRLLTLVGPGGIGKTRLALEAAQRISMFAGVQVVYLQALTSPEFIITTIAETLGLHFYPGSEPHQQLLDYLSQSSMLLVLDNFEHLLDGAELLTDILEAAPDMWLLVTSRERLNLREEWVLDVSGLPYPSRETDTHIKEFDAIRLFVQHARKAKSDFVLTDKLEPTITRICRLLGGMPLAIELAASWVRVLPCEALAAEIERSLDILETSVRNMHPRHRNMRAVFEPTWEHLSVEERRVFSQLSVFRGGFTHEAAEQVAGASLQTLTTLVDKSLLRIDANGRYDLHELLRQYGEEHLHESREETARVRDLHCRYYAEYVQARVQDLKGRRQLEALAEIMLEFENVRIAWRWASDCKSEYSVSTMLEGLRLFLNVSGRTSDYRALFQYVQQQFADDLGLEHEQLWGRLFAYSMDEFGVHPEQLEKALQIARRYDDRMEIGLCLLQLGDIAYARRDYIRATQFYEQSLTSYRQLNDPYYLAEALFLRVGRPYWKDWTAIKDFSDESLRLRRTIGDRVGTAWSLWAVAVAEGRAGHFVEAEQLWLERIALGREIGNHVLVALGYAHASHQVYFIRGEFDKAFEAIEHALQIATELGDSNITGWAHSTLGLLASMKEDYLEGKRLCQQAASAKGVAWLTKEASWGLTVASCGLGDYKAAHEYLSSTFDHMIQGRGLVGCIACLPIAAIFSVQKGNRIHAVELLALAFTHPVQASGWMEKWPLLTRLRLQLEQALGYEAYMAAWERGRLLDLDDVATELLQEFQGKPLLPKRNSTSLSIMTLSERELEVLRLVAEGCSNQEIADRLYIGLSTVKKHINHIYDKLDVKSRTQAVAFAREQQILMR